MPDGKQRKDEFLLLSSQGKRVFQRDAIHLNKEGKTQTTHGS